MGTPTFTPNVTFTFISLSKNDAFYANFTKTNVLGTIQDYIASGAVTLTEKWSQLDQIWKGPEVIPMMLRGSLPIQNGWFLLHGGYFCASSIVILQCSKLRFCVTPKRKDYESFNENALFGNNEQSRNHPKEIADVHSLSSDESTIMKQSGYSTKLPK